jgi:hypothetical protein
VRPVSDELLLGIAGIAATVSGLFFVGVYFYLEVGVRMERSSERASNQRYMRAGTRIVLLLFGLALLLSLTLVALELAWARALFVVMGVVLVASNVETVVRIRSVRSSGARTLVVHEVMGTVGVIAIITLPWILGGPRPGREDLTVAVLIALATALLSIGAMALSAFDVTAQGRPRPRRRASPRSYLDQHVR